MKFETHVHVAPVPGRLEYVLADHSFAFHTVGEGGSGPGDIGRGHASLLVGAVQLEVAVDSGKLLYAWGYCPRSKWTQANLVAPGFTEGEVKVSTDSPLIAGVSIEAMDSSEINIVQDRKNGWIRFGTADHHSKTFILIATGVGLGLNDDRLGSLWLHPTFV